MKKDFRLYQKPKQSIFTPEGFEEMKKQYAALKAERPSAVDHLKKARELGDLSENGYYKASRQRLNYIDSRLFRIGYMLKHAVVKAKTQSDVVELGSIVTLEIIGEKVVYTIVGEHEASPSERKISVVSPLGKALLGKGKGEVITVHEHIYKIITVS